MHAIFQRKLERWHSAGHSWMKSTRWARLWTVPDRRPALWTVPDRRLAQCWWTWSWRLRNSRVWYWGRPPGLSDRNLSTAHRGWTRGGRNQPTLWKWKQRYRVRCVAIWNNNKVSDIRSVDAETEKQIEEAKFLSRNTRATADPKSQPKPRSRLNKDCNNIGAWQGRSTQENKAFFLSCARD